MKLNIVHNLSPCLHKDWPKVQCHYILELAETRPKSNFPESRNAFSKVRSAKLNTDVKILMPGTDYFGETALKQDIIYLSTPCGNHTITHFRCTGPGLHSNLNDSKTILLSRTDKQQDFAWN